MIPRPSVTRGLHVLLILSFCSSQMLIGVSGNTCKQCVAGTFCADEVTSTCPPNSASSPGSESIEDCVCNAGYYRDGNICVKCGFDHYCTGDQIQRACPSVTLRTLGEFTSSLQGCVCRMGHFGAPGAACTECQPGTYQNLAEFVHDAQTTFEDFQISMFFECVLSAC